MKWILPCVGVVCLSLSACAAPSAYARFTHEKPPCHLPSLTDSQVHEMVIQAQRSTQIEGMPEPIWRVTEVGCVYRYEQSAFYYRGQPVALNVVDSDDIVMVARDGRTL